MTNKDLNIIAQSSESTVVAKFTPSPRRAEQYQSEDALEKEFISVLQNQAYEYLKITKEDDLISNLRTGLEKLNKYEFSDNEWKHFFDTEIANTSQGIVEKTTTIQEDYIKILKCDNGTEKNIYLLDKTNIHNNSLQVINQYATDDGQRSNRYDVTVLVNGLPLVHIELKRRWVAIQEAFNQINRYQRESFWAASGLFEYVQLFVISNGTYTKYYSNTTRFSHIKEQTNGGNNKWKKSSNSFEFTSWWADYTNRPITDLVDFAKTFFAKHTILNILTKYCIFTTDKSLLVMRPYQIVATEKIINRIETSSNYKKYWSIDAGWYVWHTTGSGKTLTSFKTAQIASKLAHIKKVLFVVDRKDLDYQTMKEYDKFEKGAANSNTSTAKLQKQLENPNAKIIITTIQKLDKFIKKNKWHGIFDWEIVIIFDECHRSQFGDMHKGITNSFKKYYIFGFTGTPIFAINSSSSWHVDLRTTAQAFWEKLHTYTIVDAIADKNVLPFKVDYISTIKEAEDIADEQVKNIDREKALAAPERISNIVKYIREHFDQKTKRNSYYEIKERRLKGFNSIFAVSSIDMARLYYTEFQKQLKSLPSDQKLKVATIFSYSPNEEELDGTTSENPEDTNGLDTSSRDFLEKAILDYNEMFWTSYDTTADKFQNYYKDVSARVKDREIDVLIVVNMFLTWFDATTLNTLWIDKNLQSHWLIQAFSRTNRILNSIKTFGNIICFRNLEKKVNEAISLFGDKQASWIVLLKTFNEYYNGYTDDDKEVKWYKTLVQELTEKFPLLMRIDSENEQKEFIKLYGWILRVRNILTTFDDFFDKEILTPRDLQDYHSMYIDLYNEFRKWKDDEKENINDDLVFEMELIKQIEINIDYIIELIKKYHLDHTKNKEILFDINRAIESSVELRNKKDLIEQFIQTLDISSSVDGDWIEFVEKKKIEELDKIIIDENLNHEETYKFVENSFKDWAILTNGIALTKILPRISPFSPDWKRLEKKKTVIERLTRFFDRFFDISSKEI
jgi:type I restriction enzyme R subunit